MNRDVYKRQVGDGPNFQGVYDREAKGVYLFERTERNERMAPEVFMPLEDMVKNHILNETRHKELTESINLLDEVGVVFDHAKV